MKHPSSLLLIGIIFACSKNTTVTNGVSETETTPKVSDTTETDTDTDTDNDASIDIEIGTLVEVDLNEEIIKGYSR